ncbi:MAG: glycosyltransferase family 4 protein [Gammaproteobacteria bacterium]|nr:glycosyltransferase family 4 protein [Gammaproteobacteria bacterium]
MRLTVVQTLPSLGAGGVERGTLEVAAELVKRGHRSIVISAGGRLVDTLIRDGSEHVTMPLGKKSPFTMKYIMRLRNFLSEQNVSVLHARSRLPAWISFLAWSSLPISKRPRFITTVHGPYSVNAYSKIMTKGERVIAVSEYIRQYILDNYPGVDEKKIEVIHRGVAPDQYTQNFKPDKNWLNEWNSQHQNIKDKHIISLPGRITRRKGHEDFINIINTLVSNSMSVHGLVIGGPQYGKKRFFEQLQNRVKTTGLDEHITFLGHRNDIKEILSISNIVLSLSKEPEAFGRTALEALYLGIPVIAYDIGGTTEILKEIFPQGIIPQNQIDEATRKIREFIQRPPLVPVYYPFTLEQMLNRTIKFYETLAAI